MKMLIRITSIIAIASLMAVNFGQIAFAAQEPVPLPLPARVGVGVTIAGDGSTTPGYTEDGKPATAAKLTYPTGVAVDGNGNKYILDKMNGTVRKVDANGIITTIAGTHQVNIDTSSTGDGDQATKATLASPNAIAINSLGDSLYIAESAAPTSETSSSTKARIRKVDLKTGIITTVYETNSSISIKININGIALDQAGNIYITESDYYVKKIDNAGTVTVIAGTGVSGTPVNDNVATNEKIGFPVAIVVDKLGNVYFSDMNLASLLKIDTYGILTCLDNCNGGIAVDDKGNIYYSYVSGNNGSIHEMNTSDSTSIVAGSTDNSDYNAGPQIATNMRLYNPVAIAIDAAGSIYIADTHYNVIRKVTYEFYFDKNIQATKYQDITVPIETTGYTFSDIKNGINTLVKDTDYTVSGDMVTIDKAYLETLPTGVAALTFDYGVGNNQILTINMSDTTIYNSTISPTTASFDKYTGSTGNNDAPVTVTLNGNTLTSVLNGQTALKLGTDYTIDENKVKIAKAYLKTLAVKQVVLTFKFSAGADQALTITLADTTPAASTPAASTPVMATLPHSGSPVDANVVILFGLIMISAGGIMVIGKKVSGRKR